MLGSPRDFAEENRPFEVRRLARRHRWGDQTVFWNRAPLSNGPTKNLIKRVEPLSAFDFLGFDHYRVHALTTSQHIQLVSVLRHHSTLKTRSASKPFR